MRRKAASLLLVAMMMSVAVPVHASEQATVTIQESQGENREVDQVQSSETTESKPSTSQITTTAERKEEVTSTHKKKQNKKVSCRDWRTWSYGIIIRPILSGKIVNYVRSIWKSCEIPIIPRSTIYGRC